MKYSLGPDKINSSLGQISSFPAFFFSVQLFVFNAGIDLWLGEGSYAKQYKLHRLTNIQNAIELSFIFGGVSLNFSKALLWRSSVVNSIVPQMRHTFFFFLFSRTEHTSVSVFQKPAFIIEISLFEWYAGWITKAGTCAAFTRDRGCFFSLWEIRVTESVPNITIKSSIRSPLNTYPWVQHLRH